MVKFHGREKPADESNLESAGNVTLYAGVIVPSNSLSI